jgi:hypothetical protein
MMGGGGVGLPYPAAAITTCPQDPVCKGSGSAVASVRGQTMLSPLLFVAHDLMFREVDS